MDQASPPPKIRSALFTSPKRKREQNDECHLMPSRRRTQLPSSSGAAERAVSPRSTVVSQFQALGLDHDSGLPSFRGGGDEFKAQKFSELQGLQADQSLPIHQEDPSKYNNIIGTSSLSRPANAQLAQLQDSQSSITEIPPSTRTILPMLSNTESPSQTSENISGVIEPPPTPMLKPITPSFIRTISPLPTIRVGTSSISPGFLSASSVKTSLKVHSKADSPPPTKRVHISIRPRSPPPPSLKYADMLTKESSIKSTSSDESIDETFGLNGIGFRPTPAMAYARAQRRKQQVSEWKSREAREARQRRSARRRSSGNVPLASSAGDSAKSGLEVGGRRRVRFAEG